VKFDNKQSVAYKHKPVTKQTSHTHKISSLVDVSPHYIYNYFYSD